MTSPKVFNQSRRLSRIRGGCLRMRLRLWTLTRTYMLGMVRSLKSERAAFDGALVIMGECGVEAKSVRLDQYYAGQSAAAVFGADAALYLISKRNAAIRGC